MLQPDLSLIRAHLRLDGSEHDALLTVLASAAQARMRAEVDRPVYADEAARGDDAVGLVITADMIAAQLLLIQADFEQTGSDGEAMRRAADAIFQLHRRRVI